MLDDTSPTIQKTGLRFTNLTSVIDQGLSAYKSSRVVSEACPLRMEDVKRLLVLRHKCLFNIHRL